MKALLPRLFVATLLITASFSFVMQADEPADCSLSVKMENRLGLAKNFVNAFEGLILSEKGLNVCQGDVTRRCKTEFKMEILFRRDNLTRNVTISKSGRTIFTQDYPPNPTSQGSLKIMKTLPTCAELKAAATR